MTGSSSPAKLQDLAFSTVSCNWNLICESDSKGNPRRLKNDVKLPWEISDRLLSDKAAKGQLQDNILYIFSDTRKVNLRRVNFKNAKITDIAIMTLTKHRIIELDIQGCIELSDKCLPDLIKLKTLRSLNLSRCPRVLNNNHYIMEFYLPELRKLNISYTQLSSIHLYLLTKNLPKLLALDVSGVVKNSDMKFLYPHQNKLVSLVLHNCIILNCSLQDICKVKTLRHLDISVSDVTYAFHLSTSMLKYMIENLTNLTYLDLSGNHVEDIEEEKVQQSMIGGVAKDTVEGVDNVDGGSDKEPSTSTIKLWAEFYRSFEFLGLLNIDEGIIEPVVSAKKIASLSCEANILTALQIYRDRKLFALDAMNAFFDLIRAVDCKQVVACVEAITSIMSGYPGNDKIQIPGSASLFHLSRTNYRIHYSSQTKQLIITVLLDAIENTNEPKNITLLRNCGLTLLNFDIPADFYFQFKRIVQNMIKVVKLKDTERLLPRIYVYMCNAIVCHVEGEKKLLVGKLGLIECMLDLIRTGLDKQRYDEVMETAWSALWNVTDETPFNCNIFIKGDGMDLFLKSLKAFPDKTDLLRNMMGLIGNVSEVPKLRPELSRHVHVFVQLLCNMSDGIEVSYNAAGTLSHIASDGPKKWVAGRISRNDMLIHLERAIDSWDINSQRNINYRSFQPILKLLDQHHTYQVQLWAIWAITNLCIVSSEKYCTLLKKENGIEKLENLLWRSEIPEKIKRLITTTIRIYSKHTAS